MSKEARRLSIATTLTIVLFTAFFDTFTQIPMISPYAESLGAGAVMTGWIVGIYSLTNSFGNIVAGIVLDKWGRRLPLAVGLAWAGLGVFLYGVASTPTELLGARAFHGLGGSILVPAIFAIAADTSTSGQTGRIMARIGAMIGIAAMVGPMVSGILRQVWGPQGVFITVFFVMASGALLALTLPETLKRRDESTQRPTGAASAAPVPLTAPAFQLVNLGAFGVSVGLGTLTYMIPLQLERQGFGAAQSSSVFSVFAIMAVIMMATVGRKGYRPTTFAAGFMSIAAAFAVLSVSPSFVVAGLGMACFGVGFGLLYPTLNTHIAALYPTEERGKAYGIFNFFYTMGIFVAPPVVGWASQFASSSAVYLMVSVAALAVAALLYARRTVMDVAPKRNPVETAAV